MPQGKVWASPDKPAGYLRKSILRVLAKRVGDELPADLMEAGEFEDADSASRVRDQVGQVALPMLVKNYVEGERVEDEDENGDEEDVVKAQE